ncbi:MAG: hypothetical protein AB1567_10050 [bacterium]
MVKDKKMDLQFKEIMNQLLITSKSYWENDELIRLEPIRFFEMPYSNILKVKLIFKNGCQNIYIKIFKLEQETIQMLELDMDSKKPIEVMENKIKIDFEMAKSLYQEFKKYPGYSTIKPIAVFPQYLAVVSEEIQGENLAKILEKEAMFYPTLNTLKTLSSYLNGCGKWLRIFQKITQKEKNGKLNLDSIIEYVDIRMKKMADNPNVKFSKILREEVIKYFEKQKRCIKDSDLIISGIHGDFAPVNIIIDGDRIICSDFNMSMYGSTYHDLTRFYHQLQLFLYKPIFRPKTILRLQKSFLGGYGVELDIISQPIFKLFMIQHVICHYFGLVMLKRRPWREHLYNKLVCRRHLQWLIKTIQED